MVSPWFVKAWWGVHCHPEISTQNLHDEITPVCPSVIELVGFIVLCLTAPLFISQLFDLLFAFTFVETRFYCIKNFSIWLFLSLAEFYYVNNIVSRRPHGIRGRHNDSRDFWSIIILSIIAFLAGSFLTISTETSLFSGQNYSTDLLYIVPFILFANCSYIHRLPHEFHASMNAKDIAKSTTSFRKIFVLFMRTVPTTYLIILRFYHMAVHEPLYFFLHVGSLAVILMITWLSKDEFYIHLHHYFIGFYFMFSSGYYANNYYLSIIVYAICTASFVEGATRWSCAPLWHKRNVSNVK